ncbi:MAG: hypothetical protein WC052_03320 [Patescibacteria group bacterium]|jgi:hypothetical protein
MITDFFKKTIVALQGNSNAGDLKKAIQEDVQDGPRTARGALVVSAMLAHMKAKTAIYEQYAQDLETAVAALRSIRQAEEDIRNAVKLKIIDEQLKSA